MATNIKKPVKYLNKDFAQFRENLVEFAKTYYRNVYNDFNPSNPETMFLEMSAYVGDVLSFYLDTTLKENLILHASERKNVMSIAQGFGYRPRPTVPAVVDLDIYQLIPSTGVAPDYLPDWRYALTISEGMQIKSTNSVNFRTIDKVNFAFSSSYDPTDISIFSFDNNEPKYYLLKKKVKAESGTLKTITFNFNSPEQYTKRLINETNIISIESVYDSDGNKWYEVPYLAQDTIFVEVPNTQLYDPTLYTNQSQAPYLLKVKKVPKRFITRYRDDFSLELIFGSGITTDNDEEFIPNPDNVGLMTPSGLNKLNEAWPLANFLYTDAYGEVPQNTTLTIQYFVGGGVESNAEPNSIQNIIGLNIENTDSSLDQTVITYCRQSISCNNPEPARGGRNRETLEEIRNNSLAFFAAQDRAVTQTDYMLRALSMPQKFGSIAKAFIIQDEQLSMGDLMNKIKNPLTLNLYVLGYNSDGQFVTINNAIKENLITYLNRYRMATDSINIKNAFIINIGLNYTITVLPNYQANEVLLTVTNELKNYFDNQNMQINKPIIKNEIINLIANIDGVQSVINVDIYNIYDQTQGYSNVYYSIPEATMNGIIYPSLDPSIFEIKYPDRDIYGRVISY